jgi:hypothetical protein
MEISVIEGAVETISLDITYDQATLIYEALSKYQNDPSPPGSLDPWSGEPRDFILVVEQIAGLASVGVLKEVHHAGGASIASTTLTATAVVDDYWGTPYSPSTTVSIPTDASGNWSVELNNTEPTGLWQIGEGPVWGYRWVDLLQTQDDIGVNSYDVTELLYIPPVDNPIWAANFLGNDVAIPEAEWGGTSTIVVPANTDAYFYFRIREWDWLIGTEKSINAISVYVTVGMGGNGTLRAAIFDVGSPENSGWDLLDQDTWSYSTSDTGAMPFLNLGATITRDKGGLHVLALNAQHQITVRCATLGHVNVTQPNSLSGPLSNNLLSYRTSARTNAAWSDPFDPPTLTSVRNALGWVNPFLVAAEALKNVERVPA